MVYKRIFLWSSFIAYYRPLKQDTICLNFASELPT